MEHSQGNNVYMKCLSSHQLVSKSDVSISFMDLTSVWVLTDVRKLLYMYVTVEGNNQGKTLAKFTVHQANIPPEELSVNP